MKGRRLLPGVPEGSNPPKIGSTFLLVVRKSAKISKQNNPKDAQNHFGQLMGKIKTVAKIFLN
jgi:hypothetical protein